MAECKQDMPPPGGYAPINYKYVPIKKGWSHSVKFGLSLVAMGLGWVGYHAAKDELSNNRIEMRCAKIALLPMMYAEADRMVLKQLRRNRDAEEKLMKDVEGWEVGKWKGQPVFLTIGSNDYFRPIAAEYYAHAERKDTYMIQKILENV